MLLLREREREDAKALLLRETQRETQREREGIACSRKSLRLSVSPYRDTGYLWPLLLY